MHVGIVVFNDVDYGLDLANALHEVGAEPSLYLSARHVAPYLGTVAPAAERLHELQLIPATCNVRTYELPRTRDPRSVQAMWRIACHLQRDRVDVVHILAGPGELWPAALSLFVRRLPVVCTMIIPRPNVGESLPGFVPVAVYQLLAWQSDLVVVNGAAQVAEVQDLYGLPAERVAYVPLGPRTTALKWARVRFEEDPATVLFFGAARPHKGLQYLVQAQPLVTQRIPDAKFLIASRGDDLKRCQELIVDRGRFEIYDGFVPGDRAAEYFQRACAVILPYLSASTSGILMTAAVFGKPVVATCVGCLPEYVQDGVTGQLVPPADVESLAGAIIKLLSDDTLRRQMGQQAYRYAQEQRLTATHETLRAYERAVRLHNHA